MPRFWIYYNQKREDQPERYYRQEVRKAVALFWFGARQQ